MFRTIFLPLAFLLFTFVTVHSQDISELEKRNGFKDIKLGMIPDSLKGTKFKKEIKERDEFPAKLYTVEHDDYSKIGTAKVDKIEVKAYNNMIYEITVVTDKDPRLMKALESIYGKSEYDIKRETYFWKSENLILKFRSHSKHQLELVYISFPVLKKMKEDKDQKIDDIADGL